MLLQNAVKQRILNLCNERNITINKLSTMAGVTQSTVDALTNGKSTNPKTMTILRICRALDMELYQFYNDKLFSNIDDD